MCESFSVPFWNWIIYAECISTETYYEKDYADNEHFGKFYELNYRRVYQISFVVIKN